MKSKINNSDSLDAKKVEHQFADEMVGLETLKSSIPEEKR